MDGKLRRRRPRVGVTLARSMGRRHQPPGWRAPSSLAVGGCGPHRERGLRRLQPQAGAAAAGRAGSVVSGREHDPCQRGPPRECGLEHHRGMEVHRPAGARTCQETRVTVGMHGHSCRGHTRPRGCADAAGARGTLDWGARMCGARGHGRRDARGRGAAAEMGTRTLGAHPLAIRDQDRALGVGHRPWEEDGNKGRKEKRLGVF